MQPQTLKRLTLFNDVLSFIVLTPINIVKFLLNSAMNSNYGVVYGSHIRKRLSDIARIGRRRIPTL
jgi:hypothetical protein